MSSGLLLHAIMACGNVTSLDLARLESSTAKGTLFYDRSFLIIFPMSIFEINTEDVYISRKQMMIKTARACIFFLLKYVVEF